MIVSAETTQLYHNAEKLKSLLSVLEDTVHELYSAANRLHGSAAIEQEAAYLKGLSRSSAREIDTLQALQRVLRDAAELYEENERRIAALHGEAAFGSVKAGAFRSAAESGIHAELIEPERLHEVYQNTVFPLIYTTEGSEEL